MEWQGILAISCVVIAWGLGARLAWQNAHDTARQQSQLEARRIYKREKNRRLARFYGIDLDSNKSLQDDSRGKD